MADELKIEDYKLDYITRLFKSIRNKRFESYVIQRLWHQLDDDRIKFVSQQYFARENGKYALADLYLPQIKLIIEVDEGQHELEENKVLDAKRSMEILNVAEVKIERVKIYNEDGSQKSLTEVNARISDLVHLIKAMVTEKGDKFIPWNGDFLSVKYHQQKGYFSVAEDDYIKNIDDAAAVFGTKAKHRGILRVAGFDVPGKPDYIVWCPAEGNSTWRNEYTKEKINGKDTAIIKETKINDPKKNLEHLSEELGREQCRITFFHHKDALGFKFYKFIGVFKLNKELSQKESTQNESICVWECCDDRYDF